MKQNSKWFKIGALSIILALGLGVLYNFVPQKQQQQQSISFYDDARDNNEVQQIFKENWYWLIASFPTYEPDYVNYMFRDKNAGLDPRFIGMLNTQVLRENNQLAGLVAYYMESWYEGRILFLAIRESFRGKGYAEKLLDSAIEDLKKRGATKAVLLTRQSNVRAQKVYKRAGFTEVKRDNDGFVHFEKLIT